MPSIGPWEIILILAIVLIIFGPGKLPELGKLIGDGLREFREARASDDVSNEKSEDDVEE
ncbi:MAG TPA: twin-arginine translocase TatA/TatE family subunit [Syntrophomonadaceae bacterium]|nr:twin-arginine translocase TatA/TatE family subunit [Syntrophomonadaceae bacterium]